MRKWLRWIVGCCALWCCAMAGLVIFGTVPAPAVNAAITRPFASIDDTALPPLRTYPARDGARLSFRQYPAAGQNVAVLLHGSAGSGIDMHPLALALQAKGVTVYVPDIRGHGADRPHGDIAHGGQLEEDLEDFLRAIRPAENKAQWTLVGFSSGGGFALRVAAERPLGQSFDRYILLSPYLRYDAPSMRSREESTDPAARQWAAVSMGRIIGLSTLNALGVHYWDSLPVVRFAVPANASAVTQSYSWRLLQDFKPHEDYLGDIRAVSRPMHVYVGSADQLFVAARVRQEFATARPDIEVTILPGMGHSDMVTQPSAIAAVVAEFAPAAPPAG